MTRLNQHLLVVDDDQDIRDLVGDFLSQYGYKITLAANGEEMQAALEANNDINLIVLDVMMPGEDGLTLCRKVRSESQIPIIMLTAMGEETDRIVGLEVGADDYLPKPFNPRELLARIKAIMRRAASGEMVQHANMPGSFKFSGWRLDVRTRQFISPDGVDVPLSAGEYDLLVAFLMRPQQVLSRDHLLDITRNREAGPFDRSIDVQISRLRQKVEEDPKQPALIKTVRGGGYMFTADVEAIS